MAKRQVAFPTADSPLLKTARAQFLEASHDQTNRTQWSIDSDFKNLKQWDDAIKAARESAGRPTFTIDQIGPSIRQVCNLQRQAAPSVHVIPVDSGADQETAEIFEGLARTIQDRSQSQLAYDWGFEDSVSLGLGWIRLFTDYVDDQTRDQDIQIGRVLNMMAVFPDPTSVEPTFSDMGYLFYVQDYTVAQFKAKWPKAKLASLEEFTTIGTEYPHWFPDKRIRVAEYWYKTTEDVEGQEYDDGVVYTPDQTPPAGSAKRENSARRVTQTKVCRDTINAVEVLDHQDWPGKHIPWIPCVGEELFVNGQRVFRGIIRAGRDAQKLYNYERTSLTEQVALSKAPDYVADAEQIEPYREIWAQRTTRNMGYLPYKAKSVDGHLVPPPQLNEVHPDIQGTMAGIELAKQDLKSTTNYYDPTDPSRKNSDQSGRAIEARFEASTAGNSHYLDNFTNLTLRWLGVQLIDLIPKVYDTPGRIVRILGTDDKAKTVMLNQPFVPNAQGQPQAAPPEQASEMIERGFAKFFDLGAGRYDVTVNIGKNAATARQETVENGINLMKFLPPGQAMLIAPTVVENMDTPGSQKMAEILKKSLPPQFQEDEQGNPEQKLQQMQQQMAQMSQVLEMLTKELNAKNQYIDTEKAKLDSQESIKRLETESRERIEAAKIEVEAAKVTATIDAQRAQQQIDVVQTMLAQLVDSANEQKALSQAQQHEREMSEMGHQQQLEQGDVQHQQGLEAGAMQHGQNMEAAQQQAALQPPEAGA